MTRRWRAETTPGDSSPTDFKRDANRDEQARARHAWRRFVSCMEALPPDQAAPLWREAQAQAAEFLGRETV